MDDAGEGAGDRESCGYAEDGHQQREVELRQRAAPGGMSMAAHHRHRTMVLWSSWARCLQSHPRWQSLEADSSLVVSEVDQRGDYRITLVTAEPNIFIVALHNTDEQVLITWRG